MGESSKRPQLPTQLSNAQHYGPTVTSAIDPTFLSTSDVPTITFIEEARAGRLKRACDSCSLRKVKCDQTGPPCKACAALDIPCTFQRPTRRRGPRNRQVEAFKERFARGEAGYKQSRTPSLSPGAQLQEQPSYGLSFDLEDPAATAANSSTLPPPSLNSSSSPPYFFPHQEPSSFAQPVRLSAESIGPWALVCALVDDYFDFAYPISVIPHEPTFREDLQNREDLRNPDFVALLGSMICWLTATTPRRPRMRLRTLCLENLYPDTMSLIKHCHRIAIEARGFGFLEREVSAHYQASTSALIALSMDFSYQHALSKVYFNEGLTVLKLLGIPGPAEAPTEVDFIEQETGRRVFWLLYGSARSLHLMGTLSDFFIPPPAAAHFYPPLPLEIDDDCIFRAQVLPQPKGITSRLSGFNAAIRALASVELLYNIHVNTTFSRMISTEYHKHVSRMCLTACKRAFDNLPPDIALKPSTTLALRAGTISSAAGDYGQVYLPQHSGDELESPAAKRHICYEVQKANFWVDQLLTRSFIVEKYLHLHAMQAQARFSTEATSQRNSADVGFSSENQPSTPGPPSLGSSGFDRILTWAQRNPPSGLITEDEIFSEREHITRDLLNVLTYLSPAGMASQGMASVQKVRQIASTLLNVRRDYFYYYNNNNKTSSELGRRANQHLETYITILTKLEKMQSVAIWEPVVPSMAHQQPFGQAQNVASMETQFIPATFSSLGNHDNIDNSTDDDNDGGLDLWSDLRQHQLRVMSAGGFH